MVSLRHSFLLFSGYNHSFIDFGGVVQEVCNAAVEKYGVGACGPRGFYGTMGK